MNNTNNNFPKNYRYFVLVTLIPCMFLWFNALQTLFKVAIPVKSLNLETGMVSIISSDKLSILFATLGFSIFSVLLIFPMFLLLKKKHLSEQLDLRIRENMDSFLEKIKYKHVFIFAGLGLLVCIFNVFIDIYFADQILNQSEKVIRTVLGIKEETIFFAYHFGVLCLLGSSLVLFLWFLKKNYFRWTQKIFA